MKVAAGQFLLILLAVGVCGCPPSGTPSRGDGPQEGWRSLFDGRTLAGWRVIQGSAECADGAILLNDGAEGRATIVAEDLSLRDGVVEITVRLRSHPTRKGVYTIGLRTTRTGDWSSVYCVCRADSLEVCRGSAWNWFPKPEVRATFEEVDAPQEWRFVLADESIHCHRFGSKVLGYRDPGPRSGTIAITADNCALSVLAVRVMDTGSGQ
ncbi:MAG TPA: family 16 glycoside hydrolase [Phycisphaerae bacterium]|nr:family 16 glycoside hydrolase [Phycisphaerae bacterium]